MATGGRTTTTTRTVLAVSTAFVVLLLRKASGFAIVPAASTHSSSTHSVSTQLSSIHVAVVGGGWAGFSAATALSNNDNVKVTLLDASPRGPGGLAGSGWTTKTLNQTMEAGIHGFWREYRNTFAQMEEIGLDIDKVLTPFTPSLLVSAEGRVAVAPVLGADMDTPGNKKNPLLKQIADALPPPLDLALLADYDESSKISLADRISALGLLGVWADFQQEEKSSWQRYNTISADQLFRDIAKVSPRLYSQLIVPLLHVLPMSTGYDCSAAAALSCFHVFALQSKGAFDVRWCRGSIANRIFDPWVTYLQQAKTGNPVQIQGSARLTRLDKTESGTYNLTINDSETLQVDAVVMAIGATAARRILPSCSPLEKAWDGWCDVKRGITCVVVRLILDRTKVSFDNDNGLPPVTVCGPGVLTPLLTETGFCVYNLSELQSEVFPDPNWLVVEVDYFRANPLLELEDDDLAQVAVDSIRAALQPQRLPADCVLDYGVVRARDAVSHFSVGSSSPPIRLDTGLYMCGDWIDRSGHASWSTEKAVVTGKQAAAALLRDLLGKDSNNNGDVVAATTDSAELQNLRTIASTCRTVMAPLPDADRMFPCVPWR